ncbi:hypothetical protein [Streptomyces roseoverticillatus]|nr:hypothetical protein [Streptomyces roseoverticillatus]
MIRRLLYLALTAVLLGLATGTCSGQDTGPATPPPATTTQLP